MEKVRIAELIKESIKVKESLLLPKNIKLIEKISQEIIKTLKNNGKIIFCGNGGSAADSQHLAAEFVGRFKKERKAISSLSLTTNTSILTSIANDYSFKEVFSRQIQALGKRGDLLIGISTSGNAENVILAVKTAKKIGIKTIALTGKNGGKLAEISHLTFIVPSNNTARIQEAHILIGHILAEIAENDITTNTQ
ncbi:MAG: phosphoheptose isomerase [bacterium (Candidatus Ratteibacteria) CG_4_10_14_3_um_filter_41_18]|uniref:Phosphoheptose isomerase n=3 Tax=Candidatus Ratteibacteria TaxID=2979319 RepID=A0A2M7E6J5_9BACT|nr:MAG: phosphoheptose isomerase [bacterium (Candidatus Ratteibacteria) CG01_land_8_20_14_3_00_40_19]PIW33805.1 MAG: phosphoheptose isomerase [bacterium (Candidatus Ratteibacteria) CG15_BIG_FIL_POST_REV_8_21_14_020_41_12]PIW74496.1 MAG: phosphoheptose isomerase [bacterium (Candidatus Ratteibacteria) CG_4_8_14_3_um_filter_41_36]PIX77912.1 MAG: phosphoheptose isomerase [bacterium (Candidatus Ratteibacteria) CG_4_10_14_3_um_filter_41_18]